MTPNMPRNLSTLQLGLLVLGSQIGVGILSLPRLLHEAAGSDGWMGLLLAGFIGVGVAVFIVHLAHRFPGQTLIDFLPQIIGLWPGRLLGLAYCLYFLVSSAAILRAFLNLLQVWLFPLTPPLFLALALFATPVYIARNGIQALARYNELIFFFTIWILFLLISPLRQGNLLYVLPLGQASLPQLGQAALQTSFAFTGLELSLLFIPFLIKRKQALLGVSLGHLGTVIIYLAGVITAFFFFSPDEIQIFNWPTLQMFKVVMLPFLERFEYVILTFWVLIVSNTVANFFYATCLSAQRLTGYGRPSTWTIILILPAIALAMASPNIRVHNQVLDLLGWVGLTLGAAIPLLLLLLAMVLGRKGSSA